jgi:hypothetical protein
MAQATSPGGAFVSYTASAVDVFGTSLAVVCDHPSGSRFPLGDTLVTCRATDVAGHVAAGQGTVRVRDTLKPTVTVTSPTAGFHVARGTLVPIEFSCADSGSGIVSCAPKKNAAWVNGMWVLESSTTGNHTLIVVGVDAAGNSQIVSVTYRVQ